MSGSDFRPHVLGIDDGPFDKRSDTSVPLVGVMMEGADLVEAVAVTRFPVDGDAAGRFLADWIEGLRFAGTLHAVVLGGLTLAGLAVVDIGRLAGRLGTAVIVVNRQDPSNDALNGALRAAGLAERIRIVEAAPPAWRFARGLFVTHAGGTSQEVRRILSATRGKSRLPEPLRVAHLVGAAIATGQSRGRP